MLWLIIARDGTDERAPARRQAARVAHLEGARALSESGRMPIGGALLGDGGTMIGSMLVIEAADEAEIRALIENDVYSTGDVWRSVEIHPFKRAF